MKRAALTAETKYTLLLQISQQLSGTLDLDEILRHILDTVASVVEYDAGGIFVLTRDDPNPRQGHRSLTIAGMSSRGFDRRPAEDDAMLRFGKGIVGHVITTGRTHVAADVRRDPHYVEGRRSTLSEIAAPIVVGQRPIGALNLESDATGAFGADDIDTIEFFAAAAAVSIEKAMLHGQLLEKRRITGQLAMAHDVQARLLPREPPAVDGFDIAAVSIPSFEIGGDYFDYLPLSADRLALVVADVSGKGIAAALIMATFRAAVRMSASSAAAPADVAHALNAFLIDSIGLPAFVTAVYGVLDTATGRFAYANCGHNPPIVVRADGGVETLTSGGPFLGVFESAAYESVEIPLDRGDTLLLFTDGVVEAAADDDVEFGAARLADVARESRARGAAAVIDDAVQAARRHIDVDTFRDDFTLLVIRRL